MIFGNTLDCLSNNFDIHIALSDKSLPVLVIAMRGVASLLNTITNEARFLFMQSQNFLAGSLNLLIP